MSLPGSILLDLQYLPSVQYLSKFVLFDKVIIEQHENYLKGSYRNRCHIAGPNGQLRLSIPLLKGKNEQQNIRAVQIAYHEPWQTKHWNAIRSAYGNAPFFEFYADELEVFYKQPYKLLFDYNLKLLETILKLLNLSVQVELSDQYLKEKNPFIFDYRNGIFPKKHRQKEDPHFQAKHYSQVFEDKNGFLPNLSILDLLFCGGPQAGLVLEGCIKSADD